jgi:hypothetical protein
MNRSTLLKGLLGVIIFGLLFYGDIKDIGKIPPQYGTRCRNADVEQRKKTPDLDLPTPPSGVGRQVEADQTLQEQDEQLLLPWNLLSSRLGIGLNGTHDLETWTRRLGAGWYIDWTVRPRHSATLPEHWQMVRLGRGCSYPTDEAIQWLAKNYRGNVWIIGNEPDNIWQDNITPEEYAQVYHRLYTLIKNGDPSAQVAVGGVTQASPLRLEYLNRVLRTYTALYGEPMPVDWWTLHGFVLREEKGNWGADIPVGFPGIKQGQLYEIEDIGDIELFQHQIVAFRIWMAENGYRDRPLAITEFGISFFSEYGYTPDVVAQYLTDTFTWLDEATDDQFGFPGDNDHLVQRWAWYSLYSPYYSTANLTNLPENSLTQIGQAFRRFSGRHYP